MSRSSQIKLNFQQRYSIGWRGILFLLAIWLAQLIIVELLVRVPASPFVSLSAAIPNQLQTPLFVIGCIVAWIVLSGAVPWLTSYAMQPFFPLEAFLDRENTDSDTDSGIASPIKPDDFSAIDAFHKLWTASLPATNYDKAAWKSVERQLLNAKIIG
ncbi:MAG: hypothetical protein EON58_11180 [Alphaproteobacteria bacterium]|nr:MAG: hypothetical protein EON58_11180 [Alphaproteobacteria bacterium]